jgi:hypothetical protein
MQVHKFRKYHLKIFLILVLILTGTGLASAGIAQADETRVFFPLIFQDASVLPPEAIMILSPASGSHLTSPLQVSGEADPTFEQNLVVRVLQADGTQVALAPTTIQADIGQRGPFELELPVSLTSEQNIFIQVYAESARDGKITHLSSVGVTFTPTGPEDIINREPYPEQITIFQPQNGAAIAGEMVNVRGFGLAGFEQTLLVEVHDEEGEVVGSEPVIVDAPDLGQPGFFDVEVEYTVNQAQHGRIVVRDVSPAFGGDAHLSSVEVNLAP